MKSTPKILTIAGFDPSGGAGVLADIKTISALGGYGFAAITCLTIQNTRGVEAIKPIGVNFILKQIRTILSDVEIDAIKIGIVPNKEVIVGIEGILKDLRETPIVLDPVFAASWNAFKFLDKNAISSMKDSLFPLAKVITPNLEEAALLMNGDLPTGIDGMVQLAKEFYSKFNMTEGQSIYLKGGHLKSEISADVVYDGVKTKKFTISKINTQNTHGTGCTLSTAIATFISKSNSHMDACEFAKNYVKGAIINSRNFSAGSGNGPLNHFYELI